MALRERILQSQGCSFSATVTADYGEKVYRFTTDCNTDREGNLLFTVKAPETISGINGRILHKTGQLTFDDVVLAFELVADGEISPVSAPWIMMQTLRGGYLSSCGYDADGLRLTIFDSYKEDALQLDVWLTEAGDPAYAEILWQGRRILSITVENFTFL